MYAESSGVSPAESNVESMLLGRAVPSRSSANMSAFADDAEAGVSKTRGMPD